MKLQKTLINSVTPFYSNYFEFESDLDNSIIYNICDYKFGNNEITLSVHFLEENTEPIFSKNLLSYLNLSFLNTRGEPKTKISFDGVNFISLELESSYEKTDLLKIGISFSYEKISKVNHK